jgi:hypothetical protein
MKGCIQPMKKLTVLLILVILVSFAMSFSASAVKSISHTFDGNYMANFIDNHKRNYPSYPYVFALYYHGSFYYVYSKSNVINVGTQVMYTGQADNLNAEAIVESISFNTTLKVIEIVASGSRKMTYYGEGYLIEYSTAKSGNITTIKNQAQSYGIDIELIFSPDITDIQDLINQAKAIEDIGYTSETWSALQSSISSAESIIDSGNYTQAQIDSARNAIQNAISGLEVETVVNPSNPPVTPPGTGFDLGSGNIGGYIEPVKTIYFDYVKAHLPLGITLLSIMVAIKIIPIAISLIIRGLKR